MVRRGRIVARQISRATRKELIGAVGIRYRAAGRAERGKILDEFTKLTGFHRKHAIRVLAKEPRDRRRKRARARLYGSVGEGGAHHRLGGRRPSLWQAVEGADPDPRFRHG